MAESLSTGAEFSTAKRGQRRPLPSPRDRIVLRKFGDVAKLLWPANTAAHLAAIGHKDERTGKRWLRGELEPPLSVVLACVHEMLRRQD